MFGDVNAACRHHEGHGGGYVEGSRAVAAGAAGVNYHPFSFDLEGLLTHDHSRPGNLLHRLPLDPKCRQVGADLGIATVPGHDLIHYVAGGILLETLTVYQVGNGVLDVHDNPLLSKGSLLIEEIGQNVMSPVGKNGFRVELHPLHRQCFVFQPHDQPVFGAAGHHEAVGQALFFHHQ